MSRYPFLPSQTHKTSAKNHRLLTIAVAIWFCRPCQCTPYPLWMHGPVAEERWLMTSQYHIVDRRDNLNPQVWVFLRLFVSLKLSFIVPFHFWTISIYFSNLRRRVLLAGYSFMAEKWHWQVQKVTKSHKCRNDTLKYHNVLLVSYLTALHPHLRIGKHWQIMIPFHDRIKVALSWYSHYKGLHSTHNSDGVFANQF